jgi:YesN/AraC family two-component response regulator
MWQAMLRILVADDVPMVRAGLKSLLETHEGWSVCGEAGDGQDAVQKALDLTPDVVLLDVSMPHLNGLQAAEIIKKHLPSATIYFLLNIIRSKWRGPRQKSARVTPSRRFIYPQT